MIPSRQVLSAAVFALALSASAHAGPPAFSEPKTFGQLHQIMMMGKSDPNVKLSELPAKNVYAVGALSGMRGEVTILDGAVWLSYGKTDGSIELARPKASAESATLLVYSQVSKWQKVQLPDDVPFAQLDATVERVAKERGIDTSKPFPVRIEGELAELKWHSLKGVAPQPGGHSHADHDQLVVARALAKARGQLVGFFSTSHQGVFTHMGENTHFHVVLPAEKQMGHVDSVVLKKGATLLLPG
jgi:alpha-acetolactate decarboxylase